MPSIHPKVTIHTTHVRFGIQANGYLSATLPTADLKHLRTSNNLGQRPHRAKLTRDQQGKLFMEFRADGALGVETTSKTTRFTFTPNQLNFKHGTVRVHAKTVHKIKAVFDQAHPLILNFVEELPEKIQQRHKEPEQTLPFKPSPVAASPGTRSTAPAPAAYSPLTGTILAEVTTAKNEFNRMIRKADALGVNIQVEVLAGEISLSIEL